MIDGVVTLEVDGSTRTLMREGEARIAADVPHRLWSAGEAGSCRSSAASHSAPLSAEERQRLLRAQAEVIRLLATRC